MAGYFALEMCASGFDQYCWRRLLTISAEDCWGILTQEVKALQDAYKALTKGRTKEANKTDMTGWVCVAKAVILMAEAKKSRDADHLVCFIYDQQRIDAEALARSTGECQLRVLAYRAVRHGQRGLERDCAREVRGHVIERERGRRRRP